MNGKSEATFSDFLALCIAAYQLLLPAVGFFIVSIIALYLVLKLIYM